jgi:hypothetical protein
LGEARRRPVTDVLTWSVENQYQLHVHDLRWQCGCPFATGHDVNRNGCTMVGWRHSESFSRCVECLANLKQNGVVGASVVRAMREYGEEQ